MEREILINKIMEWEDFKSSTNMEYIDQNTNFLADKIIACRSDIRSAIESWLDNRVVTHVSVGNLSEEMLVKNAKMTHVAAYLTLDWVSRAGDSALFQLKKEYNLDL